MSSLTDSELDAKACIRGVIGKGKVRGGSRGRLDLIISYRPCYMWCNTDMLSYSLFDLNFSTCSIPYHWYRTCNLTSTPVRRFHLS